MKDRRRVAIGIAEEIEQNAYGHYSGGGSYSTFSVTTAATIIQAAIDEAVRETLDNAADRGEKEYRRVCPGECRKCTAGDDCGIIKELRAAILVEE